ncbi:MAG: DUF1015 domain-containing protein [Lentisphaerae bacterium]|nr:DUF1015 domain-containing protein [Lentisphaerota bacterium]
MRIQPFKAWRPAAAVAAEVASVPYDVVDRAEAAAQVLGKPLSFLHVTRAEIDLPESMPPYADQVYAKARENFKTLQKRGTLVQESSPKLFVYRQEWQGHVQRGVAACCHVDDYTALRIKKHEKTLAHKEADRLRHILELRAHTGVVFLAYRDQPAVDALVQVVEAQPPLYDFTAADGVRHVIWRAGNSRKLVEAFKSAPGVYIADGHHRAAAAARVAEQLRAQEQMPTGQEEYNWFPVVLFPASQLKILPYNRCVRNLNGLTEAAFLEAVGRRFRLTANAGAIPPGPGQIAMFLGGRWLGMSWAPQENAAPVSALDVSILQDNLLAPILGISDPRTDKRIEFIGGIRGVAELERLVKAGQAAAAFSLAGVTISQLMTIADQGQCLPPKSTWFEPKLRDGVLVHTF